ncbi:TNF receptor-associated factor 5-like [Hydractinia symbiolongicarpus]|uniref:TNF receptor-associated factor 5-like n=1 Tax=Hydractinia symbiolongicarpus TaxID=13093 RepID=UPI0025517858|nr:TNF receptor-associated factor 5-like [Hydractinia symbiolongicarpus]
MLQQHVVQYCGQKDGDCNGKKIKELIAGLSSRLLECEMKITERDGMLKMTEIRLINCEKDLKVTKHKLEKNEKNLLVTEHALSICEKELKTTKDRLRDCEEKSLKKDAIIERLSCVNSMGFFQWTINNYNSVKWSEELNSPYFYSSYNGYKCQLSAEWYGPKRGRMGLYFFICKGENDDELVWPFPMEVRLQSTDINGSIRSVTVSFLTDNLPDSWERPEGTRTRGIGSEEFLHMPQLTKYTQNDKMVIYCFFDL